jgi:hypothetical protein
MNLSSLVSNTNLKKFKKNKELGHGIYKRFMKRDLLNKHPNTKFTDDERFEKAKKLHKRMVKHRNTSDDDYRKMFIKKKLKNKSNKSLSDDERYNFAQKVSNVLKSKNKNQDKKLKNINRSENPTLLRSLKDSKDNKPKVDSDNKGGVVNWIGKQAKEHGTGMALGAGALAAGVAVKKHLQKRKL